MPILTVEDIIINETAGFATLTFRLDAAAAGATSVSWNTSSGSANTLDYTSAGTTVVNFAAGETVKTIQVPINNDAITEGNEYFFVNLSSPVGLTLERPSALVTIAANDRGDRAPVASVADVAVDESDGTANFVITLDRAAGVPVTVNYTTSNGTATGGGDFTAATGSVTFAAGETVKVIPVSIANDAAAELAETFRLTLTGISGVTGAALGDATAEAVIGQSDTTQLATPTLSIDDLVFSEGEANGLMRVTFRLNAPSASETSVVWSTSSGSANTLDYQSFNQTLRFAAGETVKTIQIPVGEDTLAEGLEYFFINLSSPVGLNLDKPFATISIVDNDIGSRAPIASVGDVTVDETDGFALVTITLDQSASVPVAVSYATANGSAAGGSDFATVSETVTFNPGETARTIRIAITNDTGAEAAETFQFQLTGISGVTGAAIGDGSATVTIGASDRTTLATPTVSIDDMTFSEGETTGMMQIVFRLSAPSASQTSVNFSTSSSYANTLDYQNLSSTLTFEPGETVKVVRVPVREDTGVEGAEQFFVNLSGANGLRIDKDFATITIADNDRGDRAPVASVGDATVDETDGFAHFAITLDRASSVPVTVSYRTQTGSAGASDFAGQTASVTFNPGETVKTVSIAITDDTTAENAEAFTLKLTGISGVTDAAIGDGEGSGSIGLSDRTTVASPQLTVANVSDLEGGDGVMTFEFRLSAPSASAASVNFSTASNTATTTDYRSLSGTLTFAPGETVKTVQVPIADDATVESTETFTLNLTSPVGLTLAAPSATGTIRDNDAARVSVATTEAEVTEGTGAGGRSVTVFIYREGVTTASQAVTWAIEPSATNGVTAADFVGGVLPGGTVTFAAGETAKAIVLQIARDSTVEADESFQVVLSAPTGGLRLDNAATGVTILNDDTATPSQFSVAPLSADKAEGNTGTTAFTFTIQRTDASTAGSVAWSVAGSGGNPATATDFVSGGALPSGTVNFAVGQLSQTLAIDVAGDSTTESDEGFTVTLSAPVGGTIGTGSASGVIRNDDGGGGGTITGTNAANTLTGTAGNDTILGLGGADTISGLGGNDSIDGGGGADRITGGVGADTLTGGAQGDVFVFTSLSDSTPALAGRDRIADFAASQGDRIDLSAIDADSLTAGDQAFVLVAEDFTGVAGEISIASWGTTRLVRADIDGDGVTDFAVTVVSSAALENADFLF
jgi:hypothetical protein